MLTGLIRTPNTSLKVFALTLLCLTSNTPSLPILLCAIRSSSSDMPQGTFTKPLRLPGEVSGLYGVPRRVERRARWNEVLLSISWGMQGLQEGLCFIHNTLVRRSYSMIFNLPGQLLGAIPLLLFLIFIIISLFSNFHFLFFFFAFNNILISSCFLHILDLATSRVTPLHCAWQARILPEALLGPRLALALAYPVSGPGTASAPSCSREMVTHKLFQCSRNGLRDSCHPLAQRGGHNVLGYSYANSLSLYLFSPLSFVISRSSYVIFL